ncbi:MAG TPA: alpha/beta hydrolase [Isosphaeraceae bacterium]
MSEIETESPPRPPCPAPADFRRAVADYDRSAEVIRWDGPRYRMTVRVLGDGPPLIVVPGVASTYRGYCLTLNTLADRFRTILYDYPGDNPDDGARLGRITHEHLVDDVFGLIDHLNLGRVFLFGLSFGSTITLKAIRREPRRFPRAAIQGGFAHRKFTPAEKTAFLLGRLVPGQVSRLPFHGKALAWNNLSHFPNIIIDRWPFYVEQNGLTPIAALAHRLGLVTHLDLRPILKEIQSETLLIHGNEDRLVGRRFFDELKAGLPKGEGLILPIVGHQPHYTHAELLAQVVGNFLLPCNPEGCPNEAQAEPA